MEKIDIFYMNNIMEGNKLIAEFMGWKVEGEKWTQPNGTYWDGMPAFVNYHNSWDSMMRVIHEIEALKKTDTFTVHIINRNCTEIFMNDDKDDCVVNISIEKNSKMINTWLAVIKFIKWYNERKQ